MREGREGRQKGGERQRNERQRTLSKTKTEVTRTSAWEFIAARHNKFIGHLMRQEE